jgi:hypothetical protein
MRWWRRSGTPAWSRPARRGLLPRAHARRVTVGEWNKRVALCAPDCSVLTPLCIGSLSGPDFSAGTQGKDTAFINDRTRQRRAGRNDEVQQARQLAGSASFVPPPAACTAKAPRDGNAGRQRRGPPLWLMQTGRRAHSAAANSCTAPRGIPFRQLLRGQAGLGRVGQAVRVQRQRAAGRRGAKAHRAQRPVALAPGGDLARCSAQSAHTQHTHSTRIYTHASFLLGGLPSPSVRMRNVCHHKNKGKQGEDMCNPRHSAAHKV